MRLFKYGTNCRHFINHHQSTFWMFLGFIPLYFIIAANTAHASTDSGSTTFPDNPVKVEGNVLEFLANNFAQLPENQVTTNNDASVYAHYAQPTMRYRHGILGDSTEAQQLVVVQDGMAYTHTLTESYVYEDIQPRLFDVDNDGKLEIITIRTHLNNGAGIMIYKIVDNVLSEYAWVKEIGIANRWLNIVASYDLDSDGIVELAWIQTPHIGGVLKVADIKAGELVVLDALSGYSNHAIGERNLCLSVVTKTENGVVFYAPSQNRRQIAGFWLSDKSIKKVNTISQSVDFSIPLLSQHDFGDKVVKVGFCSGL
ncbi:FG-GAP repeat domain-containing protein [Vibrio ulleungensis]|uniref:VCBS repeat-containing protein n=1 Tax=Vibrio ulleungensis TaxID=2807619 RepID=A0ABS2HCN8_9VIBR|nr:VCBS repeat-containing protein [Vibrio ulleungensis]MBM7035353.1 hypothetical protein [Vibrio ulleungensis]